MTKVVITGSGAAYGVPSIPRGWGVCDPHNPKNRRLRAGVYVQTDDAHILIDTAPDLHAQLEMLGLDRIDAVLYTHTHADHLHGLDDLRGMTCCMGHSINFYATEEHIREIRKRFSYVIADGAMHKARRPELEPNEICAMHEFRIHKTAIMPLAFAGHTMPTTGFSISGGQVVVVPDFQIIPPQTLQYLQELNVNLLIMPLTAVCQEAYHAGLETVLHYAEIIQPKRCILTHMGIKCDYEAVAKMTPENMMPAYDGLTIEL
ncbi:MAG: MBL fold metallo-hydrolase [Alphaproteobacteria bacterium]|jgi:phosphoribosyl 1,2-cyclic phosphate phosphodiesterase|nr:MBL fold metallo-hydrolase [Alphaproteobacteria bacterium]